MTQHERHAVSNRWLLDRSFSSLLGLTKNEASNISIADQLWKNPPVTSGFSSQSASNTESVPMSSLYSASTINPSACPFRQGIDFYTRVNGFLPWWKCHDSRLKSLLLLWTWMYMYISAQHLFRQWLVAYLAPSHYLNQCWVRPLGANFSEVLFNIQKKIHSRKCIWKHRL